MIGPFVNNHTPKNPLRIMLIADYEHPFVYRSSFPQNLPEIDLVLAAGDLSGAYLEFVATKLTCPVVYVHGNHNNEMLIENGVSREPGGVINAHGRILEVAGLTIAGWGGVPKYREKGDGQYTPMEAWTGFRRLDAQLTVRRLQKKRPVDILLTHAPPVGPHAGQDFAHRGCPEISRFMKQYHPKLLVHGHIHEYEGKKYEYVSPEGTRVMNAYGYRMIELETATSSELITTALAQ
jgi:uncharacterized protein